jgi:hypothetical protein
MSTFLEWSPGRRDLAVEDHARSHTLPPSGRPRAAERGRVDLAVPIGGRHRIQRALEQAEVLFTARVAQDGGIDPWRRLTEARFLTARRTFARQQRLSRGDTAALIVALIDESMRDRCWVQVERDRDAGWIRFWFYLVRRALPPYRAEPLFLLAWSAWRLGEPQLAQVAADAALVEEPGHLSAAMLRTLVRDDIDPLLLPSLSDRYAVRRGAR